MPLSFLMPGTLFFSVDYLQASLLCRLAFHYERYGLLIFYLALATRDARLINAFMPFSYVTYFRRIHFISLFHFASLSCRMIALLHSRLPRALSQGFSCFISLASAFASRALFIYWSFSPAISASFNYYILSSMYAIPFIGQIDASVDFWEYFRRWLLLWYLYNAILDLILIFRWYAWAIMPLIYA